MNLISEKQLLGQTLSQQLFLSPEMIQSLHLLQLPLTELASAIEEEVEKNPLLSLIEPKEFYPTERSFRKTKGTREEGDPINFIENCIEFVPTLFQHLMEQAQEQFTSQDELKTASYLIGMLDEKGFLTQSLEEILLWTGESKERVEKVLKKIQQFDPIGSGAKNLQERWQILLNLQKKTESLAYLLVSDFFEDILHNRFPHISKKLKIPAIQLVDIVQKELLPLKLSNHEMFSKQWVPSTIVVADLLLVSKEGQWTVEINEESCPKVKFNAFYLRLLKETSLKEEEKQSIKENVISGKKLIKNIFQREETLKKVGEALFKKQKSFLLDRGSLHPLTMKELGNEIGIHESTVARAISNKFIETPRGLVSLRSCFSNALTTETGEQIATSDVKELICQLISKENPSRPLSDQKISKLLSEKGIFCARRTVAKYRSELKLGGTSQRKRS